MGKILLMHSNCFLVIIYAPNSTISFITSTI